MLEYNLLSEYTSLFILTAVIISFRRDYEARTLRFGFLKAMYYSAFISVVLTITSILSTTTFAAYSNHFISYILTLLYFVFLPCLPVMFVLYSITLTDFNSSEKEHYKKLFPYCLPYLIYIMVILLNVFTDKVFTINENNYYIRGDWYQAPFIVNGFYVLMLLYLAIKNRKTVYKEIMQVLSITFLLSLSLIFLQFFMDDVIFTGASYTLGILIVHLYIQNVRKSADHLTNVNNRIALMHRINQSIQHNECFSLYIISLRNFKSINERYGLETGDKILRLVSKNLSKKFSINKTYRYSGDEFALLSKDTSEEYFAAVDAAIDELNRPISIEGIDMILNLIFVRVDYPAFSKNAKDLISAADYSVRTLKEQSGDVKYYYDISIMKKMSEINLMTQKMKDALSNHGFVVHYQPIFSVEKNAFTKSEALVRMRDKDTLLYPNSFIELAEKSGLVTKITYEVLEVVCKDLRELLDDNQLGAQFESVSINFPYYQFILPNMVEEVMCILSKHKIPPSMIKIEITERVLISDAYNMKTIMKEMQEKGFVFELDDFGIEYSNMSVFLDLPLDIIKIDRSLLLSATKSKENRKFFEYLILGIKSTNKKIVVEGIEELEQKDLCVSCKCDYIQGYYFSKPTPISDALCLIGRNSEQEQGTK